MVTVKYSRLKGKMYVKTGKNKVQEHTLYSNDINATALHFIKKYFEDTIIDICNGRINSYNHSLYRDGDAKKEFFMKLKCSVSQALQFH